MLCDVLGANKSERVVAGFEGGKVEEYLGGGGGLKIFGGRGSRRGVADWKEGLGRGTKRVPLPNAVLNSFWFCLCHSPVY